MTVYVDQSIFPFRGQMYCHVWADTVVELHVAAQRAGLRRAWFQCPPKASWEHYDCAPRIRALLVKAGAVETDKFGPLEHLARQAVASGVPDRVAAGHEKLAALAKVRALNPGGAAAPAKQPDLFQGA